MKAENKNLMRWLEITAQYHNHKFITDEKYYSESHRKSTVWVILNTFGISLCFQHVRCGDWILWARLWLLAPLCQQLSKRQRNQTHSSNPQRKRKWKRKHVTQHSENEKYNEKEKEKMTTTTAQRTWMQLTPKLIRFTIYFSTIFALFSNKQIVEMTTTTQNGNLHIEGNAMHRMQITQRCIYQYEYGRRKLSLSLSLRRLVGRPPQFNAHEQQW